MFKKWLKNKRKVSSRTVKDYLSSLMKWPREITPEIALEYLDNKYCVISLRLYIQFLGELGYLEESVVSRWLKLLKVRFEAKEDIREVEGSEVAQALEVMREYGRSDVELVYLVMLFSGCRLSEAIELVNDFNEKHFIKINEDYGRYALMKKSKSKRALWLYLPNFIVDRIKIGDVKVTRDAVSRFAERHNILRPKYIRKFFYQRAREITRDRELVDFYQGRGVSIGSRHYDRLLKLADREYVKIMKELTSTLENAH